MEFIFPGDQNMASCHNLMSERYYYSVILCFVISSSRAVQNKKIITKNIRIWKKKISITISTSSFVYLLCVSSVFNCMQTSSFHLPLKKSRRYLYIFFVGTGMVNWRSFYTIVQRGKNSYFWQKNWYFFFKNDIQISESRKTQNLRIASLYHPYSTKILQKLQNQHIRFQRVELFFCEVGSNWDRRTEAHWSIALFLYPPLVADFWGPSSSQNGQKDRT